MSKSSRDEPVNGAQIAASILSRMEPSNRQRILAAMRQRAPGIAQRVEENINDFAAITALPDRSMQVLLHQVAERDVVLSLKSAEPEVREHILRNMSPRKRILIEEEITLLPPVRKSEVNEAQRRILASLEKLRTSGQVLTEDEKDIWV